FDIRDLEKILISIRDTACTADVKIITGDTKVAEKGAVDKIFINTSGVGEYRWDYNQDFSKIEEGDSVVINGDIADHGTAVMVARGDFKIKADIFSDVAPLNKMIEAVLNRGFEIKFIRDCTRGGLAATLNEIARGSGHGIRILEDNIPVKKEVKAVCDILGLEPLYVANEGKAVFVIKNKAKELVGFLKKFSEGKNAVIIGNVEKIKGNRVILETSLGAERIIDMPSGENLPRIC
ncbi:MAG TPA: hydrogenase expression/formation protein HypE, partial [Firmicutes bacterium]|nr:hydrogenase expression/formation protein HypE [Bacillota bacterium]